uniref:Uncharacterized protein n=1 Tax=Populus trichocarpa TaxID=3694 RepID=B9HAL9_POPTR|eukprot:XP_002308091.1 uncharacterized protein LOC7474706 [Populus trichocarpa]
MKMLKRKEVDEVSDDFSDFSLSAPARKIRRLVLGADLPPIIEEEEGSTVPVGFVEEEEEGTGSSFISKRNKGVQIEELIMPPPSSSSISDNEERAIVLFKPVNNLHMLHHSPNDFSVSLDSNIISGFKNQVLWSSQSGQVKPPEEEEEAGARRDYSMAVVPWVPSQAQHAFAMMDNNASAPQTEGVVELMDFEEMGEATMDIEEDNDTNNYSESVELGQAQGNQAFGFGGIRAGNDGFPQWSQQHCMMPQIAQNANPTPITWFQ